MKIISTSKNNVPIEAIGHLIQKPTLLYTSSGNLQYANPPAQHMFGIEAEYKWRDFVAHFSMEGKRLNGQITELGGLLHTIDRKPISIKMKNGSVVSIQAQHINAEDNIPSFILCTVENHDVDSSSHQKDQIIQNKLDLASETARFGVWELDFATNEWRWNDSQLKIYGITREEFGSKLNVWKKAVHPEDIGRVEREMEKLAHGEKVQDLEFRIIRSDGDVRTILAVGIPVYGKDQEITGLMGINIDVTDQRENEAALRANTELLDHVLDVANMYFFSLDFDDDQLYIRQEIKSLFGIQSKEKITLENFHEYICPLDFDRIQGEFGKSLADGKFDLTFRILGQGNEIFWVRAKGYTILSTKGCPKKIEGILQDITPEKNKELELLEQKKLLEESKARLMRAETVAKMGHWAISLEDFSHEWSSGAYEIYGIKPGTKITSDLIASKIHPDDIDKKEMRHPFPKVFRHRIIVDEKVKWLEVESDDHYQNQLFGTIKDVTQEELYQQQLIDSEKKYRSIFENISEGFIQLDLNGKCLVANPAAASLLYEKSPEDLVGKNFFRKYFINPRDLRYLRNVLDRPHENRGIEIKLRRADGNVIICNFNVKVIVHGSGHSIEGTFRDITREVEVNDFVISASIEAEDKQRRIIAQNLHDGVQQTMIAAKMNLESIRDKIPEECGVKFENGLALINKGIGEIRFASHNLMPQTLQANGLKVAMQDLVTQLDGSTDKTTFGFLTELGGERFAKKIEIGLYRIAQEAANNILKYAQAQQAIFQLTYQKGRLVLTIRDNGKGFDSNKSTEQRQGFGIISMHHRAVSIGGQLTIQSWPEKGTEISVEVHTAAIHTSA